MDGRQISIELIPASDIADTPYPFLDMMGQNTKAISSRIILAIREIDAKSVATSTPAAGDLNWRINIEDKE